MSRIPASPVNLRPVSRPAAAPPRAASEQPRQPARAQMSDRFETRALRTPPPAADRTSQAWQRYCEQFRPAAEKELARKRASPFPDKGVQAVVRAGGGPVYVGHWSSAPGKENTPLFFQNFPNDRAPRLQLYSFPRGNEWVSFEVAGSFYKAYDDPAFTNGRRGTSSVLGFPNSGREFVQRGGDPNWPPFQGDADVSSAMARGPVAYQQFENGYLVDLGGGQVQAFDAHGARLGTRYPGGRLGGAAPQPTPVVPTPGVNPAPEFRSIFQPFEVTPGVSVPSRLGVHWGPGVGYSDAARINYVADRFKEAGVGFSTVIVASNDVAAQEKTLRALLDRGIQPVVRLLPGADYNKTMDQLSRDEMEQMARAAGHLQRMGVKLVQLDNEPNIGEGGKQLVNKLMNPDQTEYRNAMGQYAGNLAYTLQRIQQEAPQLAVGIGGFSPRGPNEAKDQQMWSDLMWLMRHHDKASGGTLLNNAWLNVHPYTVGRPNEGVEYSRWYRDTARSILERPGMKTLATEGGNRVVFDHQQDASARINVQELRNLARDPEATQNMWIGADWYLTGARGTPDPHTSWEPGSLILQDGSLSQTMQEMIRVARGEAPRH